MANPTSIPPGSLYSPPDKLEWDSTLGGNSQPPAPYLIPIQPLGMVTPVSPDLSDDPDALPIQPGMDLPDAVDANFADFESSPRAVEPAPDYVVPSFGNFTQIPAGFAGVSGNDGAFGGRPSGFSQSPGGLPPGWDLAGSVLGGLSLSAALVGTFDSNPSQGYGPVADAGQGDFYVTLGGSAAYRSKASDWTYGAFYTGGYNQYLSQTELSGYNQNAGASVNYEGGPLSLGANLGVNFGSGANRYYAAVVDQLSISYGVSGRYRISPKTTLAGSISQSLTTASGSSSSDTSSFTSNFSALWRYSSLTEFGPGVSYTVVGGSTQQDLTSVGPTLTVNYKLSSKVSLDSRVGLEFSEYADGQTADPAVSGSIALNYRASRLWGMNLSFYRNVDALPGSVGQFQEITSLRLGYGRKIRRAQLNLGVSLQNNVTQAPPATVTGPLPDSNFLSFDSSIGMPVFKNTCYAYVFLGYSDQSGGSGTTSWNSVRSGLGIARSF